ncbi:MAG: hypothetical protein HZA22_01920 [Nitrospirae bacterium]|nr:hypothetical protein [Nitrospirota bacterium]MBI5694154.1 hypothetical protein [Nitrospirota bacterium]
MRDSSVKLCLISLCAALAAFALTGCGSISPYEENMEAEDKLYQYEGNTVRYTVPDVMVEVSYLSPENLDVYFSLLKDGKYKNPFPPGPYIVMYMTIENRGEKKLLTYDPRRTELYPPKGDPTFALDYTSLYTDFELVKMDDVEERMEVYRETALDNTLAIEPGGKASGLVVFSRPKEMKGGPVLVVLDRVYLDHESARVPMLFKRGMPLGR